MWNAPYFCFGKSHGTGIVDAIIAACAQAVNATLATPNAKHFPMLDHVVRPYKKSCQSFLSFSLVVSGLKEPPLWHTDAVKREESIPLPYVCLPFNLYSVNSFNSHSFD